jgi:hypothetical protein
MKPGWHGGTGFCPCEEQEVDPSVVAVQRIGLNCPAALNSII